MKLIFLKCSKFELDSKNTIEKQQKICRFWSNCVLRENGKFSLPWQVYSSLAMNVLTIHFKFPYLAKITFCHSIWLKMMKTWVKVVFLQISTVSRVWRNKTFNAFTRYLIFIGKISKFNAHSKNLIKNSLKDFRF